MLVFYGFHIFWKLLILVWGHQKLFSFDLGIIRIQTSLELTRHLLMKTQKKWARKNPLSVRGRDDATREITLFSEPMRSGGIRISRQMVYSASSRAYKNMKTKHSTFKKPNKKGVWAMWQHVEFIMIMRIWLLLRNYADVSISCLKQSL